MSYKTASNLFHIKPKSKTTTNVKQEACRPI